MELKLKRFYWAPTYTVGKLYINGEYFCDTIEDTDRMLKQSMSLDEIKKIKVYGLTAIPYGRYNILMNRQSAKFKDRSWAKFCNGYLPYLESVPGFEGVLIHVGNTAADTLGCILVGYNKIKGGVVNSTDTF